MKAVVCKQYGPPESLVIEELPSPTAGDGQVVIDVKASGVNFPDLLIIENKYQFKPPLPFTPGGEVAGVIKAIGSGVTGLAVGDRVLAQTGFGGFASEVAVAARSAIKIPDAMDFPAASAFLMTYGTSHYALKDRAQLKAGESLVVLGVAGGVGLAAVEIGKIMGAHVIAAASADDKLQVCVDHGADAVINYAREDLKSRIKELTGGQGADVIYDPVGGDYAEPALRATNWNGRFLVIGFTAGIPRIPLNLTLLKSCQIVGVFWGAFVMREPKRNAEHIAELLQWYSEGKLKPHICATYKFEDVAKGLNDLATRKATGKVVLVP
jgi:NADPH2:quinone reductase